MIKSIKHKGLRSLWEDGNGNKLPAELLTRIEIMLEVIDSIQQLPGDLEAFKNWNAHKLSGTLKDYWSLKVNKNFRIIFKHDGKDAIDLDFLDYH